MTDLPRFGQYAAVPRQEQCPRHPGSSAVGYCKRCNRPTCAECTIPTEVGSICVDCAKGSSRRSPLKGNLSGAPVATYAILIVTVGLYFLDMVWPSIGDYLAFNPVLAYFQPWRFVTVSLVHAGFFHIMFNMLMLYLLGANAERMIGHWRFLSLYVLSSVGGSVASLVWVLADPASITTWTVGASGAIYGLLGAVLVDQLRARANPTSILILLGINLMYSFTVGGISWQGHLGGLIVGSLVAWMYSAMSRPRQGVTQRRQNTWEILGTLAVVAVLVGITFAAYQPLLV